MHRFSPVALLLAILMLAMSVVPALAKDVRQELAESSAIEKVIKRGVLRVGMSTFEPWAMKDKNGQFIGFEIDVATRLAKDLGVKLELVPTEWSGIIPALLTGKFDMIIGGMSIRPERSLKVNFSAPYNYGGPAIVALKSKQGQLKTMDDFNKPSVTFAARTGTTAAAAAKKLFPKAKLLLFDAEPQALQELLNANADAFISEAPKPGFEAARNPDKLFLPFSGTLMKMPASIAVRKGDPDTLNVLNSWIRLVEGEGWFMERFAYWFETRDWENQLP
jgi:polar amino acid transport system substrate-binding protein